MAIDQVDFEAVAAATSYEGDKIYLSLNAAVSESAIISVDDFSVYNRTQPLQIERIVRSASSDKILEIAMVDRMYYGDLIILNYSGTSAEDIYQRPLTQFSVLEVINNMPTRLQLPGRVKIQDYYYQEGLSFEQTEDAANPGGLNFGYTDNGDFIDFLVTIKEEGTFAFNYSIAATASNGRFEVQLLDVNNLKQVVGSYPVPSTGGWQSWRVENEEITLPAGHYTLRIYVASKEFNMSWFEIKERSASSLNDTRMNPMRIYPNPCSQYFQLSFNQDLIDAKVDVYNLSGKVVKSKMIDARADRAYTFDTSAWHSGMYFIQVTSEGSTHASKLMVAH
ncbi:carbohydrate-binding protein [Geofilum rubicundum]|uniref:CBM6 domain-containing protein n=1 Tax=Geofilum rubicundum JCM 15548 TaxID=1236989 RepID=A0A0E9LQR6_9BACT|nr:carbohydrate-binding protein [Geofilum rubicundum]GAO27643.1 hypothetical protein JCM15548_14481 [Geofilum rubicundum JCM 15548]